MQRKTLKPIPRGETRGFTLFEMVLGLAILVLIFGVMFRLVEGSLVLMTATQGFARKQQESASLISFLRSFCMDLPGESVLGFKNGEGSIRFTNSQIALVPGPLAGRVLEIYRQKNNDRLMMRESILDPDRPGARPKNFVEFCLATNVTEFSWFAHDPRKPAEKKMDWNDANRPAYLSLVFTKDGEPFRADFWIPSGQPAGGMPPASPVP